MTAQRRRTLDRFLSRWGGVSRRGAEEEIRSGRVRVNDQVVTDPRLWIREGKDHVRLAGRTVRPAAKVRVVVYNKRRGEIVTARDPGRRPTVVDRLPEPFRSDPTLLPVGRLDRASAGLLLFTNDTRLADRLLDHGARAPKSYRVKLSPAPSSRAVGHMASGMDIGDRTPTAPARVTVERRGEKSAVLHVILTEGRNRQIRRMAEKVGCQVEWLVRTRFGPVELGSLPPGDAREATPEEVEVLQGCVEDR